MKISHAIAALAVSLHALPALAADGAPDTTFGPNNDGTFLKVHPAGVAVTPGDVAVVGDYPVSVTTWRPGADGMFNSLRIAPDGGSWVTSATADFNQVASGLDIVHAIAVRPTGGVIAVGSAQEVPSPGTSTRVAIAAFTPSAGLDVAWAGGGKVLLDYAGTAEARAVTVLPDGRIAWAGSLFTGSTDVLIGLLQSDGTPDPTFAGGSAVTLTFDSGGTNHDAANAIAFDRRTQRLLVAGSFENSATDDDVFVTAMTLAGTVDPSFGAGGTMTLAWDINGPQIDTATSVVVDRFSRVIVAGIARDGGSGRAAVTRLLPSGLPDTSFGTSGLRLFDMTLSEDVRSVDDIAILPQPREEIAVVGTYDSLLGSSQQGFVAVIPRSGTGFQNTFDGDGRRTLPLGIAASKQIIAGLALQGGRIIVDNLFEAPDDRNEQFVRLSMSATYGDDFESGDMLEWSATTP